MDPGEGTSSSSPGQNPWIIVSPLDHFVREKPTRKQIQVFNEKMRLIKQILRVCNSEEIRKSRAFDSLLRYITGADNQTIARVLNDLKRKITYGDWIILRKDRLEPDVTYKMLRDIIIDQYVNKLKLPLRNTVVEEIIALGISPYTTAMCNNDLSKHGFKWRRLPKLSTSKKEDTDVKVILAEETEQSSRRLKYFQKIKQYREAERHIVHLEVVDVTRYYSLSPFRGKVIAVLVASADDGFINTKVESDLDVWLKNNLYLVPEKSVIVIEPTDLEMKEMCELPSITSQKSKMKKWLDFYRIPYDATDHRAELFQLIEKFKVRCPPRYKYCEYLKAHGHEVLVRPKELSYTKYFEFLFPNLQYFVNLSPSFKKDFSKCLKKVKLQLFAEQESIMAQKEMDIYSDDQKLVLLIDKIFESFAEGRITEDDLKLYESEPTHESDDIVIVDDIVCID